MATLARHDSRQYSWLWASHISPKNSKWLQENLSGELFTLLSHVQHILFLLSLSLSHVCLVTISSIIYIYILSGVAFFEPHI
jgi:hypothetical protein